MNHKTNYITKIGMSLLLASSFTLLVGCGSSSTNGGDSGQAVKNGPAQNVKTTDSSDASKGNTSDSSTNSNGNTSSNSNTTGSNSNGTSTNSNSNGSSNSDSSTQTGNNPVSGSNGMTTQMPQGTSIAFDSVTDINSLPPQTKALVNLHKAEKGTFRSDENGSTYILVGSGQAPSEGFTLRVEKVVETADNITAVTSEYKPGSTAPAVPYVVVKIKQTSKPVQAFNFGYIK